jgi:hypothetical protein
MWCRGVVVGMWLAGTLAACAVVDPVDPRYDTVNRSLAKARNAEWVAVYRQRPIQPVP